MIQKANSDHLWIDPSRNEEKLSFVFHSHSSFAMKVTRSAFALVFFLGSYGALGVQDDVVPQLRRPVLEVSLIRSPDSLASMCSVPTFSSNP